MEKGGFCLGSDGVEVDDIFSDLRWRGLIHQATEEDLAFARWLGERPDAAQFAVRSLALLGDRALRQELAHAGIERSRSYDDHAYGRASLATILGQKRLLK